MKDNIRKLAVFVMIIALAIFVAVAPASADGQKYRKTLHGEYAFTGTGACLFAYGGFNADFTPSENGPSNGPGPNFWDGVVTFNKDGHGSLDARQRYMEIPTPQAAAGSNHHYWEFTYTVDRGKITFTEIPDTYYVEYLEGPQKGQVLSNFAFSQPYDGYVSADGKNLIVSFGVPMIITPVQLPPDFPFPNLELICSGTWQGFRTK